MINRQCNFTLFNSPITIFLLLSICFQSFLLKADSLELIKDINDNIDSSEGWEPGNGIVFNDVLYFSANDGNHGHELWSYDVASNSAVMLADIYEGIEGSAPDNFVVFDGKIYFSAESAGTGQELWLYDPNIQQVTLVKDIAESDADGRPRDFVAYNDVLYFIAYREDVGGEVFKLEAGSTEPSLLADIKAGQLSSGASGLTLYKEKLYLQANSGDDSGNELFVIEPETGEVSLAADIYAGSNASNPKEFYVFDGKLYFQAKDMNGQELWRYDADKGTATLIADISPDGSSSPTFLVGIEDTLYFTAYTTDLGRELWSYNDSDGVQLVTDIYTGTSSSDPSELFVFNDAIYFSAMNAEFGEELWRYIPASSSTELVTDIAVEANDDGSPNTYLVVEGGFYFFANNGSLDQLWYFESETDQSTAILTGRVVTYGSNPTDFIYFQGKVYFNANAPGFGQELHEYDPKTGEVTLLVDIREGSNSSFIGDFAIYDEELYFSATNGVDGRELMKYSPISGQVSLVKDIHNSGGSSPKRLIAYMGALYFTADTPEFGEELYQYKADTNELTRLTDINQGSNDSDIYEIIGFNNHVYFSADDNDEFGAELWRYDPQSGVVDMPFDLNGEDYGAPEFLTLFNDKLYFVAEDMELDRILYSYDTGGNLLQHLGDEEASFHALTAFNNKLVMGRTTDEFGAELWVFDPNDSSLELIADIREGGEDSYPNHFAQVNDVLYFQAEGEGIGEELWAYDGQNVILVADIKSGYDSGSPAEMIAAGNKLVLVAEDHNTDREVWRYIPNLAPEFITQLNQAIVIEEDRGLLQFNLSLEAADENNDEIFWNISKPAEHGEASLQNTDSNSRNIYYRSVSHYHGDDTFTLTITDATGLSTSMAINVEVLPVNDAPRGTLSVIGDVIDGSEISMLVNITDNDGLGEFSYQWLDQDNNLLSQDVNLSLSSEHVFKTIHAAITYIDDDGTKEVVNSASFTVDFLPEADYDNDGLNNDLEYMTGSDLFLSDTDNDGMNDLYEFEQGTDILTADSDEDFDLDGLTNIEEMNLGTSLWTEDSDFDGVVDGSDAYPLDQTEQTNTDGDAWGNNADWDDDNDGLPDLYEELFEHLNSLNPDDAKTDLDNDGFDALTEFKAATSPIDETSTPDSSLTSRIISEQSVALDLFTNKLAGERATRCYFKSSKPR